MERGGGRSILGGGIGGVSGFFALAGACGQLCAYSLTSMSQRWEARVQHRRADLLPAVLLDSGALAFAAASGQLSVLDDGGHAVARFGFRKRFLSEISLTPAGAIVVANGG